VVHGVFEFGQTCRRVSTFAVLAIIGILFYVAVVVPPFFRPD